MNNKKNKTNIIVIQVEYFYVTLSIQISEKSVSHKIKQL